MPLLADRVRETTTTTGQGTLTLDGAPSGFRTFTGAFGNGASVYYVIAGPSEWEIGFGTTGAGTLTRDTVLVSSAGGTTKVTFSAGTKDVFCSYVADRAVTTSDAATLTNKTIDDYTNNVGANSTHFRIKASGTLAKGAVVKAVGFTPGEQAIEVAATSSASDVALGISEQALTTGQFGMAVVIGELFDVNTNGLAVGATLYSNNAGGYTTTKPSSGLYQSLGWVVRANLNNGVIAVNVVAPLYVETSTNTANTAVLRDGSGNFAANAGLFGNGTVGAPALAASADTNTGIYFPAADMLGFATGGVEAIRVRADQRVGIGTDNPGFWGGRLTVTGGALALASGNRAIFWNAADTGLGSIECTAVDTLSFQTGTSYTNRWQINASGHFLAATDTSFDIGASGANRPRDLFLGRNATVAGRITIAKAGSTTAPTIAFTGDTNTGLDSFAGGIVSIVASGTQTSQFSNAGIRTLVGQFYGPVASATAPTYSFDGDLNTGIYRSAEDVIGFSTGGAERMRLDASGNLGLGVTPSAWESTCRMLQLGAVATVGRANSGQTQLGFNYFINSAGQYTYIQSLTALRYEQVGGEHRWFTAPSGTANAAITFTQAMTLDASGNLLVGGTSAGGRLHVRTGTDRNMAWQTSTFGGTKINNYNDASSANVPIEIDASQHVFTAGGVQRWQINSSGHLLAGADATYDIGASGATRPRDVYVGRDVTISGNLTVDTSTLFVGASNDRVGIGTTAPTTRLHVNGELTIGSVTSYIRYGQRDTSVWGLLGSASGDYIINYESSANNVGIGTRDWGTSGTKVLAIGTGVEPSTGPADTVQFYSVDRSAGNTIPGFRCEGNGVTDAGITNTTVTHKIAMKINGTVYYLLATTNAT